MIVSASYKTDIPTFYGDWFINRLRAGYCKTVNPYNLLISHVSLSRMETDGLVFWTKNLGPFLNHLKVVQQLDFPFLVQHTINSYPRVLEQAVVDAEKSIDNVRRVAEEYGPRVCIWRYDTIINSSVTPREFHLATFERIAKRLAGTVDEAVISFAQLYQKTLRNMNRASEEHGFTWDDPSDTWKRELTLELKAIASAEGIKLSMCSQPQFLLTGIGEARCVDARRLQEISGNSIVAKLKGNRKECGCYESIDIGEYDTCPHGCVYCYAVKDRAIALERYKQHDPESEFLFPPPSGAKEGPERKRHELPLFDGN